MSADDIQTLSAISAIIQGVAGLLSVIVAVLAIWMSARVERRAIDRERLLASAAIKPLLDFETRATDNQYIVVLINHGLGSGVITSIEFSRGSLRSTTDITEVLYPGKRVAWDHVAIFHPPQLYIRAGHEFILAKTTPKTLTESRVYTDDEANELLRSFAGEVSQVTVTMQYEDVLGNKQPHYVQRL